MHENAHHHYQIVEKAIAYLQDNFKNQPSLEQLAKEVHLSPFHFQRVFTQWAGVSPKKFLKYISLEHAKQSLSEQQATLFDVAMESGLSGTGRLHDLFISIEGMTPGEFKDGGRHLCISYQLTNTHFGRAIIATTHRGICFLHFEENSEQAFERLYQNFPRATFECKPHQNIQKVQELFSENTGEAFSLPLHLKASPFQLKVWEALLRIPPGKLTTYGTLAHEIDRAKAARAIGTAVGKNPVALLIPCHRVIRASGVIDDYRWGSTRKKAIIGWEAAHYQKFWTQRLDALENALKSE